MASTGVKRRLWWRSRLHYNVGASMAATVRHTSDPVASGGRLVFWVVTATGLVVAGLLYRFDPAGGAIFPACPFHVLTSLHCPGCGACRAIHQLLHGNLLAALDYNILATLMVPVVGWVWASHGLQLMGREPLPAIPWSRGLCWICICVIVVFWAGRNVPIYPLSLLAPG